MTPAGRSQLPKAPRQDSGRGVHGKLRPLTWCTVVTQVERQMLEGFRILCLRDSSGAVLGFAGFRIFETFFDGKVIRRAHERGCGREPGMRRSNPGE